MGYFIIEQEVLKLDFVTIIYSSDHVDLHFYDVSGHYYVENLKELFTTTFTAT